MAPNSPWVWMFFNAVVLALLYVDSRVANRRNGAISVKEALCWSAGWIALALLFNAVLYVWLGRRPALEFLTGYLLEESLSVDNLFVFLLIFSYFRVPHAHQRRVLFWGILGAQVMRGLFILAGIHLIQRFHWIIGVFGVFLIFTGVKLWREKDQKIEPEKNPLLRLFRRVMPVTEGYQGGAFFVRQAGRWLATPLFIVLLVVETTDLVFAVDSIPAVMAVTLNPFIVYTSNICAVLGLRALYFALAGLMHLFHHLHYGLSAILVFVGVKMLVGDHYPISIGVTLSVVAGLLAASIAASLLWPDPRQARNH